MLYLTALRAMNSPTVPKKLWEGQPKGNWKGCASTLGCLHHECAAGELAVQPRPVATRMLRILPSALCCFSILSSFWTIPSSSKLGFRYSNSRITVASQHPHVPGFPGLWQGTRGSAILTTLQVLSSLSCPAGKMNKCKKIGCLRQVRPGVPAPGNHTRGP